MRDLSKRLRKIEQRHEASAPPRPWLVLLPRDDEGERLARFRVEYGCEPERVIRIKRASMRTPQ